MADTRPAASRSIAGIAIGQRTRSDAEPGDPGKVVEASVETQDARDAFPLHHGGVEGVAGREPPAPEHQFPGPLDILALDADHRALAPLHPGHPALRTFTCFRATLDFVRETQNVTLSLPRDLLKRIKRVAADRDTSVSAIMAEALANVADREARYSAARRRALEALRHPPSLGTGGQSTWTREELHDR